MTNLFTDILDNPVIFGEQLKTLRNSLEYTLDFVSDEAGLSKSFLSQVETGKRGINVRDLKNLLSVYNYSLIKFFSETADAVDGKKYNPNENIQTEEHSILLDGSRQKGKYHLILKRPLQSNDELALVELFLPGGVEYPKDYLSFSSNLRGVVLDGELLIHFKDDELLIKKGEEFSFNAERSHIYRNHKKEDLVALLIMQYPYL
jgi:transcriptional regulator with XRE-family HTH domain